MSESVQWGKVIDQTRCIGCHACSTACKSENAVPLGVNRTYVKYVDIGQFPAARRAFQVTRCNQCDHPPCVTACPTSAMYRRPDGIVDFDKDICIGCKACIAACPYDAIFINPEDHSAEKCNFCTHRLEVGLEPACVVVCPTEAILIGDLHDPQSRVSQYVNRDVVAVRRPEKETLPKLFYKGARQTTLDPLAAQRPEGGIFLWSEQGAGVVSGHPAQANNVAAAMLSYDVPHSAPWGLPVSLYVWTKAIAAGTYLVASTLVLLGLTDTADVLWRCKTLLLPQHLLACIIAGSAALLIVGRLDLAIPMAIATAIHLMLIAAEVVTPHPTAHARLAVREMVRGKYRFAFAVGWMLQLLGIGFVQFGTVAAIFILMGLLAYEHAHVGAAQQVPLA